MAESTVLACFPIRKSLSELNRRWNLFPSHYGSAELRRENYLGADIVSVEVVRSASIALACNSRDAHACSTASPPGLIVSSLANQLRMFGRFRSVVSSTNESPIIKARGRRWVARLPEPIHAGKRRDFLRGCSKCRAFTKLLVSH